MFHSTRRTCMHGCCFPNQIDLTKIGQTCPLVPVKHFPGVLFPHVIARPSLSTLPHPCHWWRFILFYNNRPRPPSSEQSFPSYPPCEQPPPHPAFSRCLK
ncbi:unnamed protein product [Ectocarpus sp. 13 AM-2016]